jgi:beta-lactamase superfamily II metal-dependent hydrolase
MSNVFTIEMLPGREGDCLWIRYGDTQIRQILIDGGRAGTYKQLKARFSTLPQNQRIFELLIITHVDRDHIEGILNLLEDKNLNLKFKDIWFNGYNHLKNAKLETFGAVQGERVSTALIKRKLPWNKKWNGKAVCLGKKFSGTKKTLEGGLKLMLLSPDRMKLTKLEPVWVKECKDAGLIPGKPAKPSEKKGIEHFGPVNIEQLAALPFDPDPAEANGSSIALIAEFKGKRALLSGDAHPDRLVASLKALKKGTQKIGLDAFKIPHHGSEHNVSEELLKLVDCQRYLISTNGSYFKHPTPTAMARIVKFGGKKKTIFFNYNSKYTDIWDNPAWMQLYDYKVVYPASKSNGTLMVSLL